MTPKVLLILAAIGIAPAVLWAVVSLILSTYSILIRPVSFSFRLISKTGGVTGTFEFRELPVVAALSIVAGATLLILGIVSILRAH